MKSFEGRTKKTMWGAALVALACIGAGGSAHAQTAKIDEMTLEQVLALPRPDQKAALEVYVEKHPDDAQAHFHLGNWYYDEYKTVEALAEYRKAMALAPDDFKALVNACIVLENTGKGEEALALYEEFITRHPKDAVAVAYYGETQWTLGRKSQAVDSYRKALAIDPNCVEAHFNMGVAFAEMGILREAVREWQAVVKAGKPPELAARARENLKKAEEKL